MRHRLGGHEAVGLHAGVRTVKRAVPALRPAAQGAVGRLPRSMKKMTTPVTDT